VEDPDHPERPCGASLGWPTRRRRERPQHPWEKRISRILGRQDQPALIHGDLVGLQKGRIVIALSSSQFTI